MSIFSRKKKRANKKRKQLLSLINKMMEGGRPLGVTELKRFGVECPLASLYEHMDKLVERDLARPVNQRLIEVIKTDDRIATRYCLTKRGEKMGYWLAIRKANQ